MLKEEARSRTESQVYFCTHLVLYSGINAMLFFIWLFAGGFTWFIFPLLGWGVGLLAHFMQAFVYTNVTDRR